MTNNQSLAPQLQDGYGHRVAARLEQGSADLPYAVTERLRAARVQAIASRKVARAKAPRLLAAGAAGGSIGFGDEGQSLWNRIASALPILALAAGLILIHSIENDRRASEVAEVDAQLLTDDLPPAAYADPGFIQFLKSGN